ncbi:MAG: MalY/PatB family protein, partial [Candidatus Syntrophosphaera sp.]
MKTDFDQIIDRRGSGCFKYDGLDLIYGREDLISLWVADMDFPIAPVIREALQKRLDHGILGYNYNPPEFYEAVADWVGKYYGIKAEREWMLLTPGIVPAINLAVLQLTQPGDGVLIQTPVYQPFFGAVLNHGRTLITNQLLNNDGYYTIDFDDFERKIAQAKLFILCSPHNPVGRVWNEEELRGMGSLCRKYKVPVVSDEIHADLVYDGARAMSIASLEDFVDLTLCCCSPSKSFNIAGLSTAVTIVRNPDLREPMRKIIWDLHLFLGNTFGIEAVIAAYSKGESWLRELLGYLQGNRDFI